MIFSKLYEGAETNTIIDVDPDMDVSRNDYEYNSDELEYSQRGDIDPMGGYSNIEESAAMAMADFRMGWASIMEQVGMDELMRMNESGNIYALNEAVDIKAIVSKFIALVKKLLKVAGDAISNLINNIRANMKDDAAYAIKHADEIKKGIPKCEKEVSDPVDTKKLAKAASNFTTMLSASIKDLKYNEIAESLIGRKLNDNENLSIALKNYLGIGGRGKDEEPKEVKIKDLGISADLIIDTLRGKNATINVIKRAYDSFKDIANVSIKEAQIKANKVRKDAKGENNAAIQGMVDEINEMKKVINAIYAAMNALIACYNKVIIQVRYMAHQAVKTANGEESENDTSKPTQESFGYYGTGFLSSIPVI